jgi:hypothetical protein
MYGTGYFNDARGFRTSTAQATVGYDRAFFYGGTGDDHLEAGLWGTMCESSDYRNEASGFDWVQANDTDGGNDSAAINTIDYIFDLIGLWG